MFNQARYKIKYNLSKYNILLCLMTVMPVQALYDNRFFPFFQNPFNITSDCQSHTRIGTFFTTSDEAFQLIDSELGIPELLGKYDQGSLAEAFVCIGKENPLKSEWRGAAIPWKLTGKIQSQGVTLSHRQNITEHVDLGFYWNVMRIVSEHIFHLSSTGVTLNLAEGDRQELDEIRRSMHEQLGLCGSFSQEVGLSDIDLYIRFKKRWEYTLKFRTVEAALRLGVLAPSGMSRSINNAASVPSGGNGHTGIYGQGELDLELREDMTFGLRLWAAKRHEMIKKYRMACKNEHQLYGTIVGPALVDPGFTVMFTPYITLENVREGLGFRAQYWYVNHGADCWEDKRCDQTVPTNLTQNIQTSAWSKDYISLSAFYDTGKMKVIRDLSPLITLTWDIPTLWVGGKMIPKAHAVSLNIECSF